MSDYTISSISSVRLADAGAGMPQASATPQPEVNGALKLSAPTQPEAEAAKTPPAPVQVEGAIPGRQANAANTEKATGEPATKPGAPAQPKPVKPEEKPVLPVNNGDNVSIHFRVDRKTNNITVFIVDRETKRVLRSIPPEELNKLKVGDLLELTA